MPITRDQFDKGEAEPDSLVLAFLKLNESLAFTLEELGQTKGVSGLQLSEVDKILENLVAGGKVETKKVKGVVYYSYKKRRLGFLPAL